MRNQNIVLLMDDRNEDSFVSFQSINIPIADEKLKRFCKVARHVLRFSWKEGARRMNSESCAISSRRIYDRVMEEHRLGNRGASDVLPCLQWLRASCITTHGASAVTPWLSGSLTKLDLAFGPEVDDLAIISCLLRAQERCVGLFSFTFTLDSGSSNKRSEGVADALLDAVKVMPKLRTLCLPSELISGDFLDLLSTSLDHLETIIFTDPVGSKVREEYHPSVLFEDEDSDNDDGIDHLHPHSDIDALSSLMDLHAIPPISDVASGSTRIEASRFFARHNTWVPTNTWIEAGHGLPLTRLVHGDVIIRLRPEHTQEDRETIILDTLDDYHIAWSGDSP